MMWAVPCFVMVTGALLLDENREVSFDKLFNKYILRVLGALVVFSMVFRIFDIIMDLVFAIILAQKCSQYNSFIKRLQKQAAIQN